MLYSLLHYTKNGNHKCNMTKYLKCFLRNKIIVKVEQEFH